MHLFARFVSLAALMLALGCGGGEGGSESSADCRFTACGEDLSCQVNAEGAYECLPSNQGGSAGAGGSAGDGGSDGGAAGEGGDSGNEAGSAGDGGSEGGAAGQGGDSGNEAGSAGDGGSAGPCDGLTDGTVIVEGTFGECAYADVCTLTGTKTRTDSVCQAGVPTDTVVESNEDCTRTAADTDGTVVTEGTFGECAYADICTLTGAKTRTDSVCQEGVPTDTVVESNEDCRRTAAETDGTVVTVGIFGECAYADVCTLTGTKTRTDSVCQAGVPTDTVVESNEDCTRTAADTDGTVVTEGTFGECAYADVCTLTGTKTRTDSVCQEGVPTDTVVESNEDCTRTAEETNGTACGDGLACQSGACEGICGDGLVRGTESCDDGDIAENDGCSAQCEVELYWACDDGEPSQCDGQTGDGYIRGTEQCDDIANPGDTAVDGDGCSAAGQIESGYFCTGEPSACFTFSVCAAGTVVVDEPSATSDRTCEACRPGMDFSTVENANSCMPVAGPCDGTMTYETQTPTTTQDRICSNMTECVPGEYVLTPGTETSNRVCEACIVGTNFSTETNVENCTAVKTCHQNAAEGEPATVTSDRVCVCNDGFYGDGTTCASQCGDGVVASDEQCDDGNQDNTDGCTVDCMVISAHACVFACDGSGGVAIPGQELSENQRVRWGDLTTPSLEFGSSVALSESLIVVGAPGSSAVYVYERDQAGVWAEEILTPESAGSVEFGYSVAVSNNRVLVGGYTNTAFLYERDGDGEWRETRLIAADGTEESFGRSVAISGERLLVGAPFDAQGGTRSGAAYLFERQPDGSWSQTKLTASNGDANHWYGYSVGLDGESAVVGAPRAFNEGGSVYVYNRSDDGDWVETQLARPDVDWEFGAAVAVEGQLVAVASVGSKLLSVFELAPDGHWQGDVVPSLVDGLWAEGYPTLSVNRGRVLVGGSSLIGSIGKPTFLYHRNMSGQWVETVLNLEPLSENSGYGRGLAIFDGLAVVGIPNLGTGFIELIEFEEDYQCYAQGDQAGDCYCKEGADGAACSGRPNVGDGVVQAAEECDDGNANDGDGCSAAGTIEDGVYCAGAPSECFPLTVCQPGEIVAQEGTTSANRLCEPCTVGTNFSTTTNAGSCTPVTACDANASESAAPTASSDRVCDCNAGFGGDGFTCSAILCDVDERVVDNVCVACDDGATNEEGDDASGGNTDCDLCGDGVVFSDEQCDDGNDSNGDSCSASCVALDATQCTGACDGLGTIKTHVSEISKALASDGAATDYFGAQVSISGDTVIVGARFDNDNGTDSGSAYIFTNEADGTWVQAAKLAASDGAAGDHFGSSVSVDGDTVIVGATGNDDMGDGSGSAYIFSKAPDGTWSEAAKLTASNGAAGDRFGYSVSISGNTVIVGAYGAEEMGGDSGSAYVFKKAADGTWSEAAKLIASDGAEGDHFGYSVSISGETVIVSSLYDDDEGVNSGSAYVFARTVDGTWSEVGKLTASDGSFADSFGYSVSISGDTAILGAPFNMRSGSVYVFTKTTTGTWLRTAKLTAADAAEGDQFGTSVSISEDNIIVGARDDDDMNTDSGSAYVFARVADGTWSQVTKLTASDGARDDHFGSSVSISGDIATVGAYGDDDKGTFSGSSYFFEALPQCYAQGDQAGDCYCKEGADGADCSGRPNMGDGVVQAAEQCDDGNADDGDGCSATGYIEFGWTCDAAEPSHCEDIDE